MLDNLTARLGRVMKQLRGEARLTETTVEAALRLSFELSTLNPGAPRKSLPYHRAILDEIWRRNPDGARRAMHELMNLTERNIISALSRRNQGDAMPAAAPVTDR